MTWREELEAVRQRDAQMVVAVEPFAGVDDAHTLTFPADRAYLLRALKDRRLLLGIVDRQDAVADAARLCLQGGWRSMPVLQEALDELDQEDTHEALGTGHGLGRRHVAAPSTPRDG
jgi:hypothetical protein